MIKILVFVVIITIWPLNVFAQQPAAVPDVKPTETEVQKREGGRRGGSGLGGLPGGAGRNASATIFAYPGTKCPVGSELYKGPETQLAAEEGAVYCMLLPRRIVVLQKTEKLTACPTGMPSYDDPSINPTDDPYKGKNIKPPEGYLWCRIPREIWSGGDFKRAERQPGENRPRRQR